jgi:Uncharacterised nucleotidyltransferase
MEVRLKATMRPETQLVLLSAGTEARRRATRDEITAVLPKVDWNLLVSVLRARKLLTTLGPRIVEASDGTDQGFAREVYQALGAGRRHGTFLQMTAQRVTAMLEREGIVAMPLKGPQLSELLYGDPGRRLSGDVDLLVDPERLTDAVAVVERLGYQRPTDFVYPSGLPQLHYALLHPQDELPPIELHWRVHWYEDRFARERLLPRADKAPAGWRPAPAAELACLLLFYARDGFVDLRLAADLAAWWDVYGTGVGKGEIEEIMACYPALARALTASLLVSETVVGLPASRILRTTPRLRLRDRLAIRLADPNPTVRRSQLHADIGFVDGLLTPTRDLGDFARRQIFLPRDVFSEYARHVDFRARSPFDYSLRVVARYGIAGMKALRGPKFA